MQHKKWLIGYIQILTDKQFTSTVRRTAQLISKNQIEPVWRYFLTYTQHPEILNQFGSYHGIELFYVFNTWENATLGTGNLFTAQDDSMETNMLKYWVNFAYTGNPNGSSLVQWPQYIDSTDCYLEINATPDGTKSGVRTEKCNFWDEAAGYITGIKNKTSIKIPLEFKLYQNYPNPFNPMTTIEYRIPASLTNAKGKILVSLNVFDILGNKVAQMVNKYQSAGSYRIEVNASYLSSGIYFYKLEVGNYADTKKMILLK